MSIFGTKQDTEELKGYIIYDVLLNDEQGNHKLLKVCLTETENTQTQFVIEDSQACSDKINDFRRK